jgi:hypothetical protein
MRPRVELAIAFGVFGLLAAGAAALGGRGRREPDFDLRRSTFLTGPDGARGYADALERLGVGVQRFRRRPAELRAIARVWDTTLFAVVGPSEEVDPVEADAIVRYGRTHDLLLAGKGADAVMRCYGYAVETRPNPMLTVAPGQPPANSDLRVWAVVARASRRGPRAPSAWDDELPALCKTPDVGLTDTLLRTVGGRTVALRLHLPEGRTVTLVADDLIFSNRALRSSAAGPFALRLAVGRYRRVVFDEYHHGYGPSGSLPGALLSWSGRSPWGWVGWQLVAVGLIGLTASAVRFGPVRPSPERRRRSPLEHVHALATVLAAAKGHDLAVRLMVQGLRRRLSRSPHAVGAGVRADPRAWLAHQARHLRSGPARTAVASLTALMDRPQDADGVLRAGNVVEDVWEDLKPQQ